MDGRRDFALGADISWYPQMKKAGFVFRNEAGAPQPLLQTLREYGLNAVRLRTWVNPSEDARSGHCSAAETLEMAKACRDMGFAVMIDYHYGDSWCDPAHQPKPKAWEGLPFDALRDALYQYTYETMTAFVEGGVVPRWAQIGNETNPGMLLPDGSTEDFDRLAALYSAGHDAVKAASPTTRTMIHLANFNLTDFILEYFDALDARGCRYDMMGFSFYPYHAEREFGLGYDACMKGFARSAALLPARLGKPMMIVETGGVDEAEQKSYRQFADMLAILKRHPLQEGFFLWEPQGARCWSGYPLSAWRDDGTPSIAMRALRDAIP